jgi:uncharacterized protein
MDYSEFIWLVVIGLSAGVISGLIGVGGGIIMIPMLVFILGVSQLTAQGTSIAVMLPPVGIAAALSYQKAGHINWTFALIIGLTFVVGAFIGSKIAFSIDQKILRKIFGIILAYVAFKMIFK